MRWINFEDKKPTDEVPNAGNYKTKPWKPWTEAKWQAWLAESNRLLGEVAALHVAGQIKARNKLIDANSKHWGKLKPWLLALSHGKCWFTEARDIASHPDVEHFRPKKEALGMDKMKRDGYWWLAFDYSNFRAACNVPNRKKGGWFPLHQKSLCSTYTARCEESEIPYLLDPTHPDDPDLLAFNEEGNAIPAPGCSEWEKERVMESIQRFKLNDHDALPNERRRVWQSVSVAMDSYLKAKAAYHPENNPAIRATIKEKALLIKSMTQEEAELSSVARWCVLLRNDPMLAKLAA